MTDEAKQQRSAASDRGIPRFRRNWRVSLIGAKIAGNDVRNLAVDAAIRAVTAIRRVMLEPLLPLTLAARYMKARVSDTGQPEGTW